MTLYCVLMVGQVTSPQHDQAAQGPVVTNKNTEKHGSPSHFTSNTYAYTEDQNLIGKPDDLCPTLSIRVTRQVVAIFIIVAHAFIRESTSIAITTAVAYPTKDGVPTGWRILQPPCLTLACRSPVIAMEGGLHQSWKRLRSSRRGRSHSCTHKVLSHFWTFPTV